MTVERMALIRERRLLQPLVELERKADKARERTHWSQEELDLAKVKARVRYKFLNWGAD